MSHGMVLSRRFMQEIGKTGHSRRDELRERLRTRVLVDAVSGAASRRSTRVGNFRSNPSRAFGPPLIGERR